MAEHRVLLLIDFQAGVLTGLGQPASALAERVSSLARTARSVGVPVLHVRTAFRPGHPEISDSNMLFARLRSAGRLLEGGADTAFAPGMGPIGDEVVITKHRIDAFWGTDLDMVLAALGFPVIDLAGIVTSGAVLSAVRSAANRDYAVNVVEDCCADRDTDVHQTLMTRVFPMTAQVVDAADAVAAWPQRS